MQAKGLGEAAFDTVADTAETLADAAKATAEAVGIELQQGEQSVEQQLKSYGAVLEDQMATAKFKGTFAEYNTKAVQYGYVAMFSAVFPLAALAAAVANFFELRCDAQKV